MKKALQIRKRTRAEWRVEQKDAAAERKRQMAEQLKRVGTLVEAAARGDPDAIRLKASLEVAYPPHKREERAQHVREMLHRFDGWKKKSEMPTDAWDFITHGCMKRIEYVAAAKAVDEAKQFERKWWLPILEDWLMDTPLDNSTASLMLRSVLKSEIRRLRKLLGATPDAKRNATRLRVQRYRERQRQAARNAPVAPAAPPLKQLKN